MIFGKSEVLSDVQMTLELIHRGVSYFFLKERKSFSSYMLIEKGFHTICVCIVDQRQIKSLLPSLRK